MSKLKVGNLNYSSDVMGDAYEFLIKKFADLSKKNVGEYYTPRSMVKLMVDLLDRKPGDTVYDCACGFRVIILTEVHSSVIKRFGTSPKFKNEKN